MYSNNQFKEDLKKLGKHIKKLREKRNLTIKEVSLKTGIGIQYLYKIEQGKAYRVLIGKHLLKIANTLKIKMSELLDFS